MNCPNLKSLYGGMFRVTIGPEHYAETGKVKRVGVDPWHYRIESNERERSHVFPWGPGRLAVSRDYAGTGNKNGQLLALPGAKLEQDGDDGVTISFGLEQFPEVAKLCSLSRKRRLTEKQMRELAERGAKYRFRQRG